MCKIMTHNDALNLILVEFSKRGCMVARRDVGLFYDRRGVPRKIGTVGEADIQGTMPGGQSIAIEVKTGNAVRTKQQKAWAERFISIGGHYILAQIKDKKDIDKL